jgi:hypothetical protein
MISPLAARDATRIKIAVAENAKGKSEKRKIVWKQLIRFICLTAEGLDQD